MFTRKSGILALVLGALVLGACEDDEGINTPPGATTITISPNPVPDIRVGAANAFTLVTSTTNLPAGATIQFTSSNTAVATVSQAGVVTCLTPGSTTITAAVSTDPTNIRNAVAVTCIAATVPPPVGIPTISIAGVTDAAGNLVNPGNVQGVVNVNMNVEVPAGVQASAVRVLVVQGTTTTEVCRTTFTGSTAEDAVQSQVPVACSFDTRRLAANGTPLFANGPMTIRAEIINAQGTAIAQATSQTFVLNNTSSLQVVATPARTANDASGLVWGGGNLSVVVTPQIFAGGTTFSTMTVSVTALDTTGVERTVSKTVSTTGVAPVTVVFRADSAIANNGLLGLEDATTIVTATGVTGQGQPFDNGGAGFQAASLRYDDAAPRLAGATTTFLSANQSNFLGSNTTFSSSCSTTTTPGTFNCQTTSATNAANVAGVVDNGVDVVQISFQTTAAPVTSSSTFATQTAIGSGQLGPQAAGALVARVQVCDNLQNCKNTAQSAAFGVDPTAPVVSAVTDVSGVQTNPTITVAAQDTGAVVSGFSTTVGFVEVSIRKDSADATGANVTRCVNVNTGANTSVPSAGCGFVALPANTSSFTIPAAAGNGYYTVTVRTRDVAGNVSTTTQRFFLIDAVAPTVTGVAATFTTGSATASISGDIRDNVDLQQYNSREQFTSAIIAGVNSLPFTNPTIVKAFGIPVDGRETPSTTIPIIRGIQSAFGSGTIAQVNGVGFSAFDQAGNYGEAYASFSTTPSTGVTATDVGGSNVSVNPATVCRTGTTAACGTTTATSTTAQAQIIMAPTATANPIQTVIFYRIDASGRAVFVSQTTSSSLAIPSSGANANQRVFTYTSSAIPASSLNTGGNTIFAVGIDANGNGVFLGQATATAL